MLRSPAAMETNVAPQSAQTIWSTMDPFEKRLRERKLVALATGPAAALAIIFVGLGGPTPSTLVVSGVLGGVLFAITYFIARGRLTRRLLAGAQN